MLGYNRKNSNDELDRFKEIYLDKSFQTYD